MPRVHVIELRDCFATNEPISHEALGLGADRESGDRQVDDIDLALQHDIVLGGAAVVTLYRRAS